MNSSAGVSKKRMAPVQVYVRIRPSISQDGQTAITSCTPKEIQVKGHSRAFSYDGIFDDKTPQSRVYKIVASKMISDVLKGYNCTVLAYGQTGTGKTHTILGNDKILNENERFSWNDESNAGIILRSIMHLYEQLDKLDSNIQRTVTVSFMEIYNEEIRDLLCDKDGQALRIYEDKSKLVRVKNLCEVTVLNPNEIIRLLKKGCEKRQVAATLMNQYSSRSHSVFTINVSIIHNKSVSEDLSDITTGKLNLVDLAGSENIARSGSKEMRAREATNINQSLLTLGRVIKALVENSSHIPYRESKLTRILQDSLGGKTKTAIIATISPGVASLDETVNTLDYAYNAKHITNCPTINLRTSTVSAAVQEELVRLKRDLFAMANEQGVYMDKDNYEEMTQSLTQYKKEIISKHETIKNLSEQIEELEAEKEDVDNLRKSFEFTRDAYQKCSSELENKNNLIERNRLLLDHYERESEKLQEIASIMEKRDQRYHEKLSSLIAKSRQNSSVVEKVMSTVEMNVNAIVEQNAAKSNVWKEQVEKLKEFYDKIHHMLSNVKDKMTEENIDVQSIMNVENETSKQYLEILNSFMNENDELIDCIEREIQNKTSRIDSLRGMLENFQTTFKFELDGMRKLLQMQKQKGNHTTVEQVNEQNRFVQNEFDEYENIITRRIEISNERDKCEEQVAEYEEQIAKLRQKLKAIKDEEKILNVKESQRLERLRNNIPIIDCAILKAEQAENVAVFERKIDEIASLNGNGSYLTKLLSEVKILHDETNNFINFFNDKKKSKEFKNHIRVQVQILKTDNLQTVRKEIEKETAVKSQMANVINQIADIALVQGKTHLEQLIQMTDSNVETLTNELQSAKSNIEDVFKSYVPVTSSGDTPNKLTFSISTKRSSRDSIIRNLTNELPSVSDTNMNDAS